MARYTIAVRTERGQGDYGGDTKVVFDHKCLKRTAVSFFRDWDRPKGSAMLFKWRGDIGFLVDLDSAETMGRGE